MCKKDMTGKKRIKEGRQKRRKCTAVIEKRMNSRKLWERRMNTNEIIFPFLQFLEKHQ